MVTFHGPMLNVDVRPDGVDEASWAAALISGEPYEREFAADEVQTLVSGLCRRHVVRGCLSLLCASLGTPYEIETRDTVLFIEDVAEPAFRIDRMLMQLKLAGKLAGVRGIIFGEMLKCGPRDSGDYTLQQVVQRIVGDMGSSRCLRPEVRTRVAKQFHIAARSTRVRSTLVTTVSLSLAASVQNAARGGVLPPNHDSQTHPSHRNLRHGDGVARGNVAAARPSGHGIGRGSLSSDVRLPGVARHPSGAAVQREEPRAAPGFRDRGKRDLARQRGAGVRARPAHAVRVDGARGVRRVSRRTTNAW